MSLEGTKRIYEDGSYTGACLLFGGRRGRAAAVDHYSDRMVTVNMARVQSVPEKDRWFNWD